MCFAKLKAQQFLYHYIYVKIPWSSKTHLKRNPAIGHQLYSRESLFGPIRCNEFTLINIAATSLERIAATTDWSV